MKRVFPELESRIAIGSLRKALDAQKAPKKVPKKSEATRCVVWKSTALYELVRKGIPFKSQALLVECAELGALTETHLYIFRHRDCQMQRNAVLPKYEGVFKCGDYWIRAQKAHLSQAYVNSNRTERERMWCVFKDDTPYFVDRYLFRKQNQLKSKERYETVKKKKRKK